MEALPSPWGKAFERFHISGITIAAPARTLKRMRLPEQLNHDVFLCFGNFSTKLNKLSKPKIIPWVLDTERMEELEDSKLRVENKQTYRGKHAVAPHYHH